MWRAVVLWCWFCLRVEPHPLPVPVCVRLRCCMTATAACGNGQQAPVTLSGTSGDFGFTAAFGQVYPKNLRCYWLIPHTATEEVRLDVPVLDVAQGPSAEHCGADGVGVYAGSSTSSTSVARLCGSSCHTCPVVVSNADDTGVLVEFVTGDSGVGAGRGFSATYSIHSTGTCVRGCLSCTRGPWGLRGRVCLSTGRAGCLC